MLHEKKSTARRTAGKKPIQQEVPWCVYMLSRKIIGAKWQQYFFFVQSRKIVANKREALTEPELHDTAR